MEHSTKTIYSRSKLTIISGFSSVLVLLVCLMVIAITRIHNNEQQIQTVIKDLSDVRHVYIMRYAAHNRALLLYRMAQTDDPFERDDMYMQFSDYASTFIKSATIVKNNLYRQEEINLFNETRKSITIGSNTQNKTAIDILEGRINKAHQDLATKIIPIQDEVSQRLIILTLSLQNNANNRMLEISSANDNSTLLISILGILAVTIGIFITVYVTLRVLTSEKAYIQQRKIAEHASQEKSMFLATMSHEIRSPLAAIIGFTDLLRRDKITLEKSKSCINTINRNGRHLLQLINDILDFSKIEAGQLEVDKSSSSPFTLLEECQSSMSVEAQNKGLRFELNYAFPLPEKINTDAVRLKQILFNLINNAIKFTDRGSVSLHVLCDKDKETMTFDVIDTGIGLSAEQQKKIFKPFVQADSSTTRKYGGSGLGLIICKQLVEKLGGTISVESTLGRGSKFSFSIDIGKISSNSLVYALQPETVEYESENLTQVQGLYGHVLLAEDSVDNQNLIEMYITDTGARITVVETGEQAVKICESQKFDLILMDMQMPVMDGIEATKKIRLSDKQTPIISLTANAMKSDFENSIDAGANEFITKPIDMTRFNQMLYKYLPHTKKMPIDENEATGIGKLEKITHKFLKELPDRLTLINRLFETSSWEELENETHKLTSIGTPLGFPEITKICSELNFSCRNNKIEEISNYLDQLNHYCEKILGNK